MNEHIKEFGPTTEPTFICRLQFSNTEKNLQSLLKCKWSVDYKRSKKHDYEHNGDGLNNSFSSSFRTPYKQKYPNYHR